jgi:adenine phosphoribosyltransferase
MARKHGKLPVSAMTVEYGTEYSKDSIEIMPDVIKSTDNVLIIDDLVATGGSLDAAKRLIQGVGGNVIGACCILQVDSLVHLAREKLNDTPLIVILE